MSKELVAAAIHRAHRLADGLYGSEYKPVYYCPRSAEDVVAALEALLADVRQNPRIISQDIESMHCGEFGQKTLDVWHPEFRVWCLGLSVDDYQAVCIPLDPDPYLIERFGLTSVHACPRILELLKEMAQLNCLHHSTFDARGLARYGIYYRDLDDSMLVNYAIDDTAGDNGVEDLARIHTEEGGYKKRDFTPPKLMSDLDWDRLANYCCHDADIERRLFFILRDIAIRENVWSHPEKIWGYQLLKLENMVGIQMTLNGCAMNREHLEALIKVERDLQAPLVEEFYRRSEVQRCFELIQSRAGTEPNAKDIKKLKSIHTIHDITTALPWALAILLYDVCGYTCPSKTDGGERQVDGEQLEKFKDKKPEHARLVDLILGIKRIEKKLSTYLLPYVEAKLDKADRLSPDERAARTMAGQVERFPYIKADGLIHSLFNFHKARSGRSSSEDPNFQNVINDILIKMCFYARMWKRKDGPQTQRGVLTAGDFQQHEVRMTAFLCRDQNMIQNLEKGFHMINLALLEKLIQPSEVASITKQRVDDLENVVQLKYLRALDPDGALGKAFGEAVYTDYHYTELQSVLAPEKHWKNLLLAWKAQFKKRRTVAKESTFGPLYGMEAKTFSTIHEIPLAEAEGLYETDRQTYPQKHAFFADVKARARKDNFVQSIFGKKRRLDYKGARGDEYKIAELDKQAGNTCVDALTEILTATGWQKYSAVQVGDPVLTKNPETGALEWNPIEILHILPDYQGELVEFRCKGFSALTTPDHRWLISRKLNTGKGLPGSKTRLETRFTTSEKLSTWGDDRIHRTGANPQPDNPLYTDAFLELCGWVVTDGSLKTEQGNPKKNEQPFPFAAVYQSKQENFETIQAAVTACTGSTSFHDNIDTGLRTWHISRPTARRLLEVAPGRILAPTFVASLSERQARIVVDAMIRGDGWTQPSARILTLGPKREAAADAFQMLCCFAGYATSKTYMDYSKWPIVLKPGSKMRNVPKTAGSFLVQIRQRDKKQLSKKEKVTHENQAQLMWCVTVRNQTFVARRNGHVFITGNCIQGPSSDLGLLCMDRCIRAYQELDLDVLPIGTVHDSLMNDSAPWCFAEQLRLQGLIMREYPKELLGSDHVLFGGDLEAGPNWGELKSWQP